MTVLWFAIFSCCFVARSADPSQDGTFGTNGEFRLESKEVTSSEIKLKWSYPTKTSKTYFIIVADSEWTKTVDGTRATLKHLKCSTTYNIEIHVCEEYCSDFISVTARTEPCALGKVKNLTYHEINSTHFQINWTPLSITPSSRVFYNVTFCVSSTCIEAKTSKKSAIFALPECDDSTANITSKIFVTGSYVDRVESANEVINGAAAFIQVYLNCSSFDYPTDDILSTGKLNLTSWTASRTWLSLQFMLPVDAEDIYYVVSYNGKSVTTNDTKLTLENLVCDTDYNISAKICKRKCSDSAFISTVRTKSCFPGQVVNLTSKTNATHAHVAWKSPAVDSALAYKVSFCATKGYCTEQLLNETYVDFSIDDCQNNSGNISFVVSVVALYADDVTRDEVIANKSKGLQIDVECPKFWPRSSPSEPEISATSSSVPTPTDGLRIEKMNVSSTKIELEWSYPAITNDTYFLVTNGEWTKIIQGTRVTLEHLKCSTAYDIEIHVCERTCSNFISIAISTKTCPPQKVKNMVYEKVNSSSIKISWDPLPETPQTRALYDVSFCAGVNCSVVKTKNTFAVFALPHCTSDKANNSKISVTALYQDRWNSTKEAVIGETECISFYPNCVELEPIAKGEPYSTATSEVPINVTSRSSQTSIFLKWHPALYKVSFDGRTIQTNESEIELKNLICSTDYDITVSLCLENCSRSRSLRLRTEPCVPGKVERVTYEVNSTHVIVSWNQIPKTSNLSLLYNVTYCAKTSCSEIVANNTEAVFPVPACEIGDTHISSSILVIAMYADEVNSTVTIIPGDVNESFVNITCPKNSSPESTDVAPEFTTLELIASNVSDSWAILRWNSSLADVDDVYYVLSCNGRSLTVYGSQAVFENLTCSTEYVVSIAACRTNCSAPRPLTSFRTNVCVPGKVGNLSYKLNSSRVHISWEAPSAATRLGIVYYVVFCVGAICSNIKTNKTAADFSITYCLYDDGKVTLNASVVATYVYDSNSTKTVIRGEYASKSVEYDCSQMRPQVGGPKPETSGRIFAHLAGVPPQTRRFNVTIATDERFRDNNLLVSSASDESFPPNGENVVYVNFECVEYTGFVSTSSDHQIDWSNDTTGVIMSQWNAEMETKELYVLQGNRNITVDRSPVTVTNFRCSTQHRISMDVNRTNASDTSKSLVVPTRFCENNDSTSEANASRLQLRCAERSTLTTSNIVCGFRIWFNETFSKEMVFTFNDSYTVLLVPDCVTGGIIASARIAESSNFAHSFSSADENAEIVIGGFQLEVKIISFVILFVVVLIGILFGPFIVVLFENKYHSRRCSTEESVDALPFRYVEWPIPLDDIILSHRSTFSDDPYEKFRGNVSSFRSGST